MSRKAYLATATLLSAAGVCFSGYLSFVRLSRGVCAFAEPCPFFLGHPACYTGFALFATALAICLVGWTVRGGWSWTLFANGAVATAGVVFAARMTAAELPAHAGYRLGLPTCAYGLVFFLALLAVSIAALHRAPGRPSTVR